MPDETILTTTPAAPAAPAPGATPPASGATPPAGDPGATPPASLTPESTSWRDALPEEIRNDPSLKVFNDINGLAKSFVHAQKMIGKDKVVIPGKDATSEEKTAFLRKLGLPETVDGYKLKVAEGQKVNEGVMKEFAAKAFEKGIMPEQAQALFDWFHETSTKTANTIQEARKAELTKGLGDLKTEWGQAFDKNVRAAQRFVDSFGDANFKSYLKESGMGNDPQLIRVLAKAGLGLQGDQTRGDGSMSFEKTPAEAKQAINSILSDQKHAYYNRSHPNHQAAVAEVTKLHEIING